MLDTDSAEQPRIVCKLRAELVPEVQVEVVENRGLSLLAGETGTQVLRVVSRSFGGDGRSDPCTVEAQGRIAARFAGPPAEVALESGIVETIKDVIVDIEENDEYGDQTEQLAFVW